MYVFSIVPSFKGLNTLFRNILVINYPQKSILYPTLLLCAKINTKNESKVFMENFKIIFFYFFISYDIGHFLKNEENTKTKPYIYGLMFDIHKEIILIVNFLGFKDSNKVWSFNFNGRLLK